MTVRSVQGWSSAYTIEAVIMQISATLVKGKARIKFDAPKVRSEIVNVVSYNVYLAGNLQPRPGATVLQISGPHP